MSTGPASGVPAAAREALAEILRRRDRDVVGVVLSGSAARGTATEHSDVDVHLVLDRPAGPLPQVRRSPAVDEVPVLLTDLEHPPPFGSEAWWYRWSYAWAKVLRDDAGGRVTEAIRRQATLTPDEQDAVLGARLDGYLNFAYRALKADRNARPLERRLDAAEAVPWLLDVVFALSARVRPYNGYLAWELARHPLAVPEWSAETLVPQVEAMLDGDPLAVRAVFAVVDRECRAFDAARGLTSLGDTVDAWGDDLHLLRP